MAEKWIIPCNVRRFDIIEHFRENETVIWKNSFTIKEGDTAYIYLGAPYGEIRYRCTVVCDEIDERTLQENPYAIQEQPSRNFYSKKIKYIQLKKEFQYPNGLLPLATLKEHGLGQVQIQARPSRNLKRYLEIVDSLIEERGGRNE